jgi:hypothetical protein
MRDIVHGHKVDARDVASIQLLMNWVEVGYPSPQFVDSIAGQSPTAGGTAFIAAYVCLHGDFPLYGVRPNPTFRDDPQVRELAERVEIIGAWNRAPYAPRITLRLRDGRLIEGEYRGDELEWDFATEVTKLRPMFDGIDWPRDRLEAIVETVAALDTLPDLKPLIELMVPAR